MVYRIIGTEQGMVRVKTRAKPSSAIVLAEKWMENGFGFVRIESSNGAVYSLREARERLVQRIKL